MLEKKASGIVKIKIVVTKEKIELLTSFNCLKKINPPKLNKKIYESFTTNSEIPKKLKKISEKKWFIGGCIP